MSYKRDRDEEIQNLRLAYFDRNREIGELRAELARLRASQDELLGACQARMKKCHICDGSGQYHAPNLSGVWGMHDCEYCTEMVSAIANATDGATPCDPES